ncbi:MAG: hypothetical protein AAFS13_02300 [Pseudomonadota bacterium]
MSILFNAPSSAQEGRWTPLHSWWNPDRADNFATTENDWRRARGTEQLGYTRYRLEGLVFQPGSSDEPIPSGMIPLWRWYSPSRGDNFTTSDPRWRPSSGAEKGPDYIRPELMGYVFSPEQPRPDDTIALWSWWNPQRGDNFATSAPQWTGSVSDVVPGEPHIRNGRTREGYAVYRLEGYLRRAQRPVFSLDDITNPEAPRVIISPAGSVDENRGCPAGTSFDLAAAEEYVARAYPVEGSPLSERRADRIYFYDDREETLNLRIFADDRLGVNIQDAYIAFRDDGIGGPGPNGAIHTGLRETGGSALLTTNIISENTAGGRVYSSPGFYQVIGSRPRDYEPAELEVTFELELVGADRSIGTDYEAIVRVENEAEQGLGLRVWLLPLSLCRRD